MSRQGVYVDGLGKIAIAAGGHGLGFFREALKAGKNTAILLGNFAQQHPQAAAIHAGAQALAKATGARLGFLGEAANSVGDYLAGLPAGGGLPQAANQKALLLLNVEPALDCADPRTGKDASFVVNLAAFRTDIGDVQLPIAPFTETPGTFVNTEGRVQFAEKAVFAPGDAREDWTILRALADALGVTVGYDSFAQLQAAMIAEVPTGPATLACMLTGGRARNLTGISNIDMSISKANDLRDSVSGIARGDRSGRAGACPAPPGTGLAPYLLCK